MVISSSQAEWHFYHGLLPKYMKGSVMVALADLTPGTRVVVDMKMDGDKMIATSVKLSAGTKKTAAAAPHKY